MKIVNIVVINNQEVNLDELPAEKKKELVDKLNRRAAESLGYIEDKSV